MILANNFREDDGLFAELCQTAFKHRQGRKTGIKRQDESIRRRLFNFAFLEDHMLAHNRIIFPEFKFFGRIAWVLFCYVIESRVGCADQSDQDGIAFGHRA